MSTTGPINGTNFLIYVGGTAIAYSTSCSITPNMSTIDVTSKDSSGAKDILPGITDWSADIEGIVALDSASNVESLFTAYAARTRVMIKFSGNVSGDSYWHGYAYITSVPISAPMEDKTTFSCSFEGDGVLTMSTKT